MDVNTIRPYAAGLTPRPNDGSEGFLRMVHKRRFHDNCAMR